MALDGRQGKVELFLEHVLDGCRHSYQGGGYGNIQVMVRRLGKILGQQGKQVHLVFLGQQVFLDAFQQVLEVICQEPGNPQKQGVGQALLVQELFQVQMFQHP